MSHDDRAGGDRAAGVSDVLFYALRPTFIPAAASVTGAVCQWHHDDSIIFLDVSVFISLFRLEADCPMSAANRA